ncbi:hypothetical protein [Spirillospora sp. NPDC048824]|uniref:hypothetical protein n=1 Tax=Spirillospora sp. NPDC048824 TaxID=3364526 RepID=UPI00371A22EF
MSESGDAIGRDQINITIHGSGDGKGWEVHSRSETDGDLADHWRTFAATPSRALLAEVLSRQRVAVLRARRRSGATTTALAALAMFTVRVREVSGNRPPASLPATVIEPGCGYVFDAVGAAWTARPRGSAVLGCRRLLEQHGAWLVVLVDSTADTENVRELLVEHEPPDPRDVLANHLHAALPGESAFVTEVLREAQPPPRTPGEAADLARALIRGHRAGRPIGAVMAGRPHPLREEARTRLRQNRDGPPEERDLARRAFLIAQAVLHDLPAAHVCRAAHHLAEQLYEVEKQKTNAKLGQLPFGDILESWLDAPPADTGGDGPGDPDIDRRLPMPEGFAEAVLHVVWFDYIVAHEALLHWLSGMAENDPDRRVRFRAALALGRLAVYDFDFMVQTCFVPWSHDRRQSLHQVTAWALEETVKRDPAKLTRVFAAADAWSRGRSITQRSTALRMYGTYLGVQNPERALRGLRHIVLKGDAADQRRWVTFSLVEIFAGGRRTTVARTLVDWASSPQVRIRRTAADSLAELAELDDPSGMPELMTMFEAEPELVGRLWRLVLTSRLCGRRPWDALRTWRKRGVDMTELRGRLESDPRLRRPLAFYLGPHVANAALPAPAPCTEEATR